MENFEPEINEDLFDLEDEFFDEDFDDHAWDEEDLEDLEEEEE